MTTDRNEARADELDELVARCLERLEGGDERAVEAACGEHPELADDLRRRLAALANAGFGTARAELPERFGEFRIQARLGQGGMGVVYRARQESLGREVALKIVRPDQLYFPGARERFRREVGTIVGLGHPGIIAIHAFGETDGVPYYAMELVEGRSLGDAIEALADRSPDDLVGADLARALNASDAEAEPSELFAGSWLATVVRVLREVAETLEHCHRRGVVHRDVKPSNVMLTPEGRVLLVDFGLSFSSGAERITRTGSQLGSLPYMAPEQIDGRVDAIDERTDVYALGVTLYEACALALPHRGETAAALRDAILAGRTRAMSNGRTRFERDVATVCAKAMAVDPERRYASAAELASDLDALLAGRPVRARPTPAWERAWLWARRRPAAAALVVAVLVAPSLLAWRELHARHAVESALHAAERERARAERNFADALTAVDRMLARVGHETLANVPHMEVVRRELLADALALYEGLLARRGRDGGGDGDEVLAELADTHRRIADVHGLLGDYEAAYASIRTAHDLRARLLSSPDDVAGPLELAEVGVVQARIERLRGDPTQAGETAQLTLDALDRLIEARPGGVEALRQRANAYVERAETEREVGRWRAALDSLRAARRDLATAGAEGTHLALRVRLRFGTIANESAELLPPSERPALRDEARVELAGAVDLARELAADEPDDALLTGDHIRAQVNLAINRLQGGDPSTAAALLDEALTASEALVTDFPNVVLFAVDRMIARSTAATAALMNGRFDEARGLYGLVVAAGDELLKTRPRDPEVALPLAYALMNLGALDVTVGRAADALEPTRRAVELLTAVFGETPSTPLGGNSLRGARRIEAHALLALGRLDEAALAAEAMAAADHGIAGPYRAAVLLGRCVVAAEAQGDLEPVDPWVDAAVAWLRVALERGAAGGDLNEPDLGPLRGRGPFDALVREAVGP